GTSLTSSCLGRPRERGGTCGNSGAAGPSLPLGVKELSPAITIAGGRPSLRGWGSWLEAQVPGPLPFSSPSLFIQGDRDTEWGRAPRANPGVLTTNPPALSQQAPSFCPPKQGRAPGALGQMYLVERDEFGWQGFIRLWVGFVGTIWNAAERRNAGHKSAPRDVVVAPHYGALSTA
uniref:Uncharacterized protein n=1 Tax=Terrapene triunguis TaxID=2587831 RepID=A0A674ITP2_9SAUR